MPDVTVACTVIRIRVGGPARYGQQPRGRSTQHGWKGSGSGRDTLCLGVALGGQTFYISFGAVDNMSVPAILGASFMDIATENIATQEQHAELRHGTKVPIRRDGARKGHPIASFSAVCACPQGGTAKLRPARKTWVKPGTIAHIPVKGTYTGHGFLTGRPLLYHNHGMQVAQGPAIMVAGEPITVQVMHLAATPLRLTTDMTVGFIDPYEGPVALRVPAHAPWLARRSLVHRVTRMTCHAPVRTGGAVGAGWDLD